MLKFTKNDELEKALIGNLKKACEVASQYSGGYSGEFLDAQEFYQALVETVTAFENGDTSQVKSLWVWFSPTTAWDDFIGMEGTELGNSIFSQLQNYISDHGIKI